MKVITKLTGTIEEAPFTEHRGILQAVHDEPVSGFIRQVRLGEAGLQIKSGPHTICIPLGEIMRLVEQHEPGFIPPVKPKV